MKAGFRSFVFAGPLLLACGSETRAPEPVAGIPGLAAAESAYYRGEYDSVKSMLSELVSDARKRSDVNTEARALTWLGLTAWREGDYTTARETGERALDLKLASGLKDDLFRSYNALGLLAHNQGRYADALSLFGKAEAAAKEVADTAGIAKANGNRALSLVDIGDFPAAREGFDAHRRFAARSGDTRGEANALANIAMLDIRLGDAGVAIEALMRARELYRESEFPAGEENVLGQTGTAYDLIGEPHRSIAYLDSAVQVARAHGLAQQESENLQLLAGVFSGLGDHPRALEYLSQARAISTRLEQVAELGDIAFTQGLALLSIGRGDAAMLRALEARQLHARSGSTLELMRDHLLLADIAQALGKHGSSDSALIAASAAADSLRIPLARLEVAIGHARIADLRQDWRGTLASLQATDRQLETAASSAAWEVHALRARAFARLGRMRDAVEAGRRAVAQLELVRSRIGSPILRSSFTSARSQVYADLSLALLAVGDTINAFSIADGARSRALLEHVAAARQAAGGERVKPLVGAERLLRRIDWLVERLSEADTVSRRERGTVAFATVSSLRDQLAAARRDYESLVRRMPAGDPRLAALTGGESADMSRVRQALSDDEVLLQFLISGDRIVVFAVSRNGVGVVDTRAGSEEIASRVRLAIDASRAKSFGGAEREVLTKLHSLLIAPVEHAGHLAGKSTIIVVPHSSIVHLPFAALIDGTGKFLVARHALLMLPSAAVLPALRNARVPRGSVSATVLAPFPDRLPGSAVEARAVERSAGARRITGTSASEKRLRAELGRSAVVHVASHASMNPATPLFSHIELAPGRSRVTADDGRLEVHEILGMSLGNDLLFLSGCETAAGTAWSTSFRRNDDYSTLSQAFLFAGARNVVASLWALDDLSAAEFARSFYVHAMSRDAAESLAMAQRRMIGSREWSAPRYWAAYTVSGAGDMLRPATYARR